MVEPANDKKITPPRNCGGAIERRAML